MKSIFHLRRPMFPPEFDKLQKQAGVEFRFSQHKLSISGTVLRVEMSAESSDEAFTRLGYYIKGFLLALNY